MSLTVRSADAATIRSLDAAIVAWFVLWVAVGTWTGITLWQVSEVGDTVSSSGRAIGTVGEALEAVGSVPVIGDEPTRLAEQARTTSTDITSRGQEVKGEIRQLAILLGISIALIPVTPVAGLYLPLRVSRRREMRRIQRSLREPEDDVELDRYLADRAVRHLSYAQVRRAVPRGAEGRQRTRALADAELRRLGLRRG